jgi:acyl-coenzyme A thioesterase PaaI-like protein
MTVFDDATAVSLRANGGADGADMRGAPGRTWIYDTAADRRFALLAPGGTAPPAVNGGALMATVLRAVLDCSPHPYPVATNANFLRVPQLAAAEVHVSWLKNGRTASTARATFSQDGQAVLDATITTGTLPDPQAAAGSGAAGALAGLEWSAERPPFPDMADCIDLGTWAGSVAADGTSGFPGQVEVLLDPACTGWRSHEPSGVPEMRGYVQLRDHRDPDALLLALAVDALPPVVFGLGATGWAPTVELTWHMRAVPAPGPLQVATRSRHVSGGWFDEEAEVWDTAGRLVAQSTQLARVGRGRMREPGNGSAGAAIAAEPAAGR